MTFDLAFIRWPWVCMKWSKIRWNESHFVHLCMGFFSPSPGCPRFLFFCLNAPRALLMRRGPVFCPSQGSRHSQTFISKVKWTGKGLVVPPALGRAECSFEQTRMAVCWSTEDATKRRTWRFAADSVAGFDFVSLNHFFPSSFLTRAETVVRSLSQQICQAWVMMPTDEMRIFVIWSRRRHLSLRFPLPFIIAEVAGRNVRLCWRNHPVMQRREERAVYLRRQIYKCLWSQCLNVSSYK